MRISEIIGLEVRTESGDGLGRVYDVRAELTQRSLRVVGLVVGRRGLLERLGIDAPEASERVRKPDELPWSDVVRLDRRGVIVRDGSKPVR
ncbi:MAG TPA: PRC-barrel domain-containing protein [Gaiellaceae bacterium]|nr:PRC-barrel domain-containing protein [Gaiellaceae bacterium]